jgi:hypothetical protein
MRQFVAPWLFDTYILLARLKMNKLGITLTLLVTLLRISVIESFAAESFPEEQWRQDLGMSGLRRSIALDSPLGELLTRNISYRMSSMMTESADPEGSVSVDSSSSIIQFNSLATIGSNNNTGFFLKTTARHVDFEISNELNANAKRLDFGILARPLTGKSRSGYFGASLIFEENNGHPTMTKSSRLGDGLGIRLESGKILSKRWSVSGKAEFLDWTGEKKMRSMNMDHQVVSNPIKNERIYANFDLIRSSPFLRGRGNWRSGIHHLSNRFEQSINSMGSPAPEPFGNSERLGIVRTGFLQMWPSAKVKDATLYIEVMADYEFENNMNKYIRDSVTFSSKAGVAWTPSPLSRIQLEWQNFKGQKGHRGREGIMLVVLLDGF